MKQILASLLIWVAIAPLRSSRAQTDSASHVDARGVTYASHFPGADCGAKIMAADAATANVKGIIAVDRTCGTTISTALNVQHSIHFVEGGTWCFMATWTQTHGGIVIAGLGLLDSSSNPGTELKWCGSPGSDILDITGTASPRLDKINIEKIIFDGGGRARYDLRLEKIDAITLADVRWRNAQVAGVYAVDATGTVANNVSCGTISGHCMVFDWGTGGSVIYSIHAENDVNTNLPLILLQGAITKFKIDGFECDATPGKFGGCFQAAGFDSNSTFPGAPNGGTGAPSSVEVNGATVTYHGTAGPPTQGADFLVTGTAAHTSNGISIYKPSAKALGISPYLVKVDHTQNFELYDPTSDGHTSATLNMTINAVGVRHLWGSGGSDPARCSGPGCGSQLDISQGAVGKLEINSGAYVLSSSRTGDLSSPVPGEIFYRSDLQRTRWYDGSAWRSHIGVDTTDSLTNKDLKIRDQGTCIMSRGTCTAQRLAHTYSAIPNCFATWTGTGILSGLIKVPSTTTTVTPASSAGTDSAQVNWVCFGN